ncbi:MAG: MBL fold metallo-hydrolase [Paracoccaceae bacterium]|nr:MBL fold metallo-hydrolase [Paracoccaceae bacterium]
MINGAGGTALDNCVILLGVKGGPAIYPGGPMPTSSLLRMGGKTILVDAAIGVSAAIARAGIALTEVDAILITHLHSDHYLELGPFLHTAWTAGLKRPIPIYGPAGLPTYMAGFIASMAFDIQTRTADEGRPDFAALCPVYPLDETTDLDLDGVRVTALRNHHPPIEESYALRFEQGGRVVVMSGDTAPIPEMAPFAKDADLLVHEAMLEQGIQALCDRLGYTDDRLFKHIMRSHTTAADAARIAAEAGAKALALNHLIPTQEPGIGEADWRAAVQPHYDGALHIGRDGMVIDLPAPR